MTANIHLATPEDAPRLLPLVEAFHAEYGLNTSPEHRQNALMPLLEGSPLGAAWLFGPSRAPTGYVVITFGWSLEFGGMEAFIDELYIRPSVRNRGQASEALTAITASLREVGVTALHLEVNKHDDTAQRLYTRAQFKLRDGHALMTKTL